MLNLYSCKFKECALLLLLLFLSGCAFGPDVFESAQDGGARISEYPVAVSPDRDYVFPATDPNDLSSAPTGTTKKVALKDLPVSDPTQAALDEKLDIDGDGSQLTGIVAEESDPTVPDAATDGEITTGTETDPRLMSPAQAKLAAETFGSGGEDAFVYIAYASDDAGADFSVTPGETLDYIATLSTGTEITAPEASDFAGLWKHYRGPQGLPGENSTVPGPAGEAGPAGDPGTPGDPAYLYIAYASDDSGTDFTMTFDSSLDYAAFLSTDTEITTPEASDFVGLWKKYKGDGFEAGTDGTYGVEVIPNTILPTAAPTGGAAGLRPVASGAWYYYDITGDEWVLVGSGGSMVYPGAGIPNSTGEAWGTSYGLDTDLSSVSATHDTLASAKAIKDYIDQELLAVGTPVVEITEPVTDATWVDSLTYTALAGTAQCTMGLTDIEWKLESGGSYAAVTDDGTLGTGEEAWTVAEITLVEDDLNTIYVKATGGNSLTSEVTRTIYADATDPTVVLPADTTHAGDGASQTITVTSVTETNEDDREYQVVNTTEEPDTTVTDWTVFTGLEITSYEFPADTDNYQVNVRATDLAGNVGSDSQAWTYENLADCSDTFTISGGDQTDVTTNTFFDAETDPGSSPGLIINDTNDTLQLTIDAADDDAFGKIGDTANECVIDNKSEITIKGQIRFSTTTVGSSTRTSDLFGLWKENGSTLSCWVYFSTGGSTSITSVSVKLSADSLSSTVDTETTSFNANTWYPFTLYFKSAVGSAGEGSFTINGVTATVSGIDNDTHLIDEIQVFGPTGFNSVVYEMDNLELYWSDQR